MRYLHDGIHVQIVVYLVSRRRHNLDHMCRHQESGNSCISRHNWKEDKIKLRYVHKHLMDGGAYLCTLYFVHCAHSIVTVHCECMACRYYIKPGISDTNTPIWTQIFTLLIPFLLKHRFGIIKKNIIDYSYLYYLFVYSLNLMFTFSYMHVHCHFKLYIYFVHLWCAGVIDITITCSRSSAHQYIS